MAQKNALNKERFLKEGENTSLVFTQIFEQIRSLNDKIGHPSTNESDENSILKGLGSPVKKSSKKDITLLRSEIAEAKSDIELLLNERLSKMQEFIEDEIKFGISNASFNSKIKSKRRIQKRESQLSKIQNKLDTGELKMSVVLEQS